MRMIRTAAVCVALSCNLWGTAPRPADVVRQAFSAAQAGSYTQADGLLDREAAHARLDARREFWDTCTRDGKLEKVEIRGEKLRGEGAEVQIRAHYSDEFMGPTSWGSVRRGKALDGTVKLQREGGQWKMLRPDATSWTIWYPELDK